MALHPDLEDERYHANEGEYAADIHEAGVVWLIMLGHAGSERWYPHSITHSLERAIRLTEEYANMVTPATDFALKIDGYNSKVYEWTKGENHYNAHIIRFGVQS